MIDVTFACGHRASVSEKAVTAPTCAVCGPQPVTHTQARAPRFVGACTGPYAETKALDPQPAPLGIGWPTKGPPS